MSTFPGLRPIAMTAVLPAVIGCESYQPPAGPSVSTPAPAPSPPRRDENVIYFPAPLRPADSAEPMVGRYTLEIVSRSSSGLRCQAVPEHAKRRIYTADI